MAPPIGKKQVKPNAALFAIMLEELVAGPCTALALADVTGMSRITVYHTLRALLHRRGLVYVAAWDRDTVGRQSIRVFAWGDKRNVPRPRAMTGAERKRGYDQKARAVKLGGTMYAGLMQ